jgi:hypothetical protein
MRPARQNSRSIRSTKSLGNTAANTTGKTALFESLENRQMMTATVDNGTFDKATVVPDIYLAQNYSVKHTVNTANRSGFYKFYNLYGQSHLYAALDGMNGDGNLYVFDQNHNVVASSTLTGNSSETINVDLNAHQYYYVAVFSADTGASVNYNLFLYNDYAGSTLDSARDIGSAWGQSSSNFWNYNQINYTDYLDYRDNVDIVKFKMDAAGTVSLRRLPVQNTYGLNATMELLDSNGNVIASPTQAADTSINLDRKSLAAGTYYVKFTQISGSGEYQYRINADYAGDTTATARDLGNVTNTSRELHDMVGTFALTSYEDATDLYKFTLSKTAPVDLMTTVQQAGWDANLSLAQDTNGDGTIEPNEIIQTSTASGTDSLRKISTTLNAGTYYIVVGTDGAGSSPYTSYTLDVDSDLDANVGDPKAYNNMSKATDLGNLVGENWTTGGFGISAGDFSDFYKFKMTADGQFSASAQTNPYWSQMTVNPTLVVIKDANNNGRFDTGEQVTPFSTGSLTANLKAGNYILEASGTGEQAAYDLRTVSNYAGSTLGTARKLAPITGKHPKTQTFKDYIEQDFGTGSNVDDFYSFTLNSKYQGKFSTTGVDGEDLSLSLIKDVNGNGVIDAGDVLVTSDLANSPNESITKSLGAGKYFLQVHGVNGATNYKLTASFR